MRKIINLAVITAISLGLSGCGREPLPGIPIQTVVYHDKTKSTGINIIRIPKINSLNTAEVGENLYSKFNENLQNTYIVSMSGGTKAMLSNNDYINTFNATSQELKNRRLFKWEKTKNAACFPISVASDPNLAICTIDINNNGYFSVAAYNSRDKTYPLSNNVSYSLKLSPPIISEDSFKYIALYQGKIGNKIKISFREFHKDMSRPSFTQDIDYELNKNGNTIIGFKGLRIEILKATNIDITYRVIQDYK